MKRILFVDDETRVLEGLRRMLHGLRSDWDMHFVTSGKEALDILHQAASPFDVVVSDMRMPGMDGAELLDQIQAKHPGVVRLILSGHADLELAMRSATCAHQFLTKPCDSDTIKSVVTRAFELHRGLENESLRRIVGQIRSLPALPRSYKELNAAMSDEDVTIRDVTDIVAQDSGIAAKVLQLVNSSFFGVARRVSTLRDAVSYIGLANIRTLVLQYGLVQEFDAASAAPSFSIEEHQRHAIRVATVARGIHAADPKLSEQAFLAGILHDIGTLVVAANMPELFERVSRLEKAGYAPSHELERRAIGVSHADIGAYLLGIWGMPQAIVETAQRHHIPDRGLDRPPFDALVAVHVADSLLDEAAFPMGAPCLDQRLIQLLGLEERLPDWRRMAADVSNGQPDNSQAA